jgi:hypothetical protein
MFRLQRRAVAFTRIRDRGEEKSLALEENTALRIHSTHPYEPGATTNATDEVLHTSGHYLKRSSARLVRIHRCFIALRYRTSWGGWCLAAGPFPSHSES